MLLLDDVNIFLQSGGTSSIMNLSVRCGPLFSTALFLALAPSSFLWLALHSSFLFCAADGYQPSLAKHKQNAEFEIPNYFLPFIMVCSNFHTQRNTQSLLHSYCCDEAVMRPNYYLYVFAKFFQNFKWQVLQKYQALFSLLLAGASFIQWVI